jgi:hypothetical protein
MKRQGGLVLNAGELFVYIKDIAIVAVKRNSKTLIGIKEFDKTLLLKERGLGSRLNYTFYKG